MPLFRFLLLMLCCGSVQASELLVSAAASLNQAFTEIAREYESAHPETQVVLNFAASGLLLQQIAKGAPVDVLAVADQQTMDAAQQQKLITAQTRRDFAGNALVVVVSQASALTLKGLKDLQGAGISRIAIGNPDAVPAGRYAQSALEKAGLWSALQERLIGTQNVRQALAYAARNEVDAAFVYRSDISTAANKVREAFEVHLPVPVRYPLATVRSSPNQVEAQRFEYFVRSVQGQHILRSHGFVPLDELP
jgi:molybdate transport system substrate-binding protein